MAAIRPSFSFVIPPEAIDYSLRGPSKSNAAAQKRQAVPYKVIDQCQPMPYIDVMIKSIRHKGLKAYWTKGQTKGLNSDWLPKIRIIMSALDAADEPEEMDFPGSRFHSLKGDMGHYFSVRLTGNFRVIFQFDGEGFILVDIKDYH